MKKKTKKKLNNFLKRTVKFTAKLIFVYPFKALWFVTKHSYHGIKEAFHKKGKENKEIKKSKKVSKIKIEPKYDQIKELKNLNGNFTNFESKLLGNKSTIGIILGARGTGKSAIGMRLLENFKVKTKKNIYAMGFKQGSLPNWIGKVESIEEINNGAVILIDEGGIEFSSRKSMSNANKLLSELLMIARHKDLSVIFITQNSSNLEINAIRQADYLVLKPSSLLQKDFERKKIKNIYSEVEDDFNELTGDLGLTYIYAGNYRGFVSNSLPSFWSEEVSKGYAEK